MNFETVLSYVLAVFETVALVGALVFIARAMHENKLKRTQKGKKGAKSNDEIDKTVAAYKRNALIFFFVYLLLNVFRNYGGVL